MGIKKRARALIQVASAVGLLGLGAFVTTGIVHATPTPNSLYSYSLTGLASGTTTVANQAAANSGATMAFGGNDYQFYSNGTQFGGNVSNLQSALGYKPTSGNTINAPSTDGVGITAKFVYQAPTATTKGAGGTTGVCYGDSLNVTQIGRDVANGGQIKLQLSSCAHVSTATYMECRLAGSATSNTSGNVIRSTMPLTDGYTYISKCAKNPDAGGATGATFSVAKIDPTTGQTVQVQNDTFTLAEQVGTMTTTGAVSVGGKWPLVAETDNTDQFQGRVAKVADCEASTATAVATCMSTENPQPAMGSVLSSTITSSATSVAVGNQVTYTATVKNNTTGATAAGTSAVVTVPANMSIVTATGATISGHTATWNIGSLAGGSSAIKTLVAQLNSGTVGATVTSSLATSTTDSSCSNVGSVCSASVNFTIAPAVAVPVIATSLSSSASSVQVGSSVTYTATAQNTASGTTATGGSVAVTLPAGMSVTNANGGTVSGSTVTWSVGSLVGGTPVSKAVVAQLNSGTTGATLVTNAAVTTTDGSCSNAGSSCSASTNVTVAAPSAVPTPVAGLTSSATTVVVGGQVTYTATVKNTSAGTTATGVGIDVSLPTNMSVVSAPGGTISGTDAIFTIGSLAGGTTATETVVAQLNSGTVGDSLVTTAYASATDGSCVNTGSNCAATNTVSVASAGTTQWIGNTSVETDATGWAGIYGTASLVNIARVTPYNGGHTGAADMQVTALSGASNSALGFSDNPRWVTNTVAGKTYNGSVWVKPDAAGQVLGLRIREWNGSTIITDVKTTITATNTNWIQISQPITTAANGNQISFIVFSNNMNAGDTFQADDMSLTSN